MNYAKVLSKDFTSYRTYLFVALFASCNIVLPQLFHMANLGAATFIPILFFTLYASVRYGTTVGLLTAIVSPLASNIITDMPTGDMLWIIMFKGAALALISHLILKNKTRVSFLSIFSIVIGYQLIGMMFHVVITANIPAAWASVYASVPGIAIQILLVWLLTRRCTLSRR